MFLVCMQMRCQSQHGEYANLCKSGCRLCQKTSPKKYCVVTQKVMCCDKLATTQYFLKKCVVAEKNKVADTCHHTSDCQRVAVACCPSYHVSRLLFLYADVIPRAPRWLQTCNSNDKFDERRLAQLVRQNMRANNVYVGLPAGHR